MKIKKDIKKILFFFFLWKTVEKIERWIDR